MTTQNDLELDIFCRCGTDLREPKSVTRKHSAPGHDEFDLFMHYEINGGEEIPCIDEEVPLWVPDGVMFDCVDYCSKCGNEV